MSCWVHHVAMVPTFLKLTTNPLSVLNAHPKCFGSIWKVGMVENTKKDDRCILLPDVNLIRRVDASRN